MQKYGGSSVATPRRRAHRRRPRRPATASVVVVSAMGDTTDDLLDPRVSGQPGAACAARWTCCGPAASGSPMRWSQWPSPRWGAEARSFTGSQAGVITHRHARQRQDHRRRPGRLQDALDEGLDRAGRRRSVQDSKDVTTLGRGGSDTHRRRAGGVEGRRLRDLHRRRRHLHRRSAHRAPMRATWTPVSFEEMLGNGGGRGCRCVEYARRYDVPIHVRSSS